MDEKELKRKNPIYTANQEAWDFYRMAYDGGRDFIESALVQHPLESYANWQVRIEEGICFNYSAAIIDLFNFYLTERAPSRHLKGLKNDPQWVMFERDADLHGTDLDMFLNNSQKLSSVYGSVGVLVNKPNSNSKNIAQELQNKIYPYCCIYTMPNIHDWTFEKNPVTNRPELAYLKLKESEPGVYTLWYRDHWEVWQITAERGGDSGNKEEWQERIGLTGAAGGAGGGGAGGGSVSGGVVDKTVLLSEGANKLGEIPFVWMPNMKNIYVPYIGMSDIREISYITASIIRNLSHGEEVIKFAGFPMLRVPMVTDGTGAPGSTESAPGEGLSVGQRAVQEFPPDQPNAKPDWLEAKIAEPIEAVLKWIDRKVDETYRIAHLSGVHGQRKSNNEVASGLALRYEFQQLNSVLLQKSSNMQEAELSIIKFWLKWQNKERIFDDIEISRAQHFSIDDLAINLENIISTMETVQSKTFKTKAEIQLVKVALPDIPDSEFEVIAQEIEQNVEEDETRRLQEPAAGTGVAPEDDPELQGTAATPENGKTASPKDDAAVK